MTSEVETQAVLAFGDVVLVSFPFTNQAAAPVFHSRGFVPKGQLSPRHTGWLPGRFRL